MVRPNRRECPKRNAALKSEFDPKRASGRRNYPSSGLLHFQSFSKLLHQTSFSRNAARGADFNRVRQKKQWSNTSANFLDRHDLSGLTASDIAEAHRKDLEVQDQYGVRFLTYWFDELRGTGFCLIDAPDIQTAMRVHDEAHGEVAKDVIEVDLSAVQAFLGRVSDRN